MIVKESQENGYSWKVRDGQKGKLAQMGGNSNMYACAFEFETLENALYKVNPDL